MCLSISSDVHAVDIINPFVTGDFPENMMPFLIILMVTPFYNVLDKILLVDVFGCGCVPIAQTNMLNIPYNANDLRLTVYLILTIGMFMWSILRARHFQRKSAKVIYSGAVIVWNLFLTEWIVKVFMWA